MLIVNGGDGKLMKWYFEAANMRTKTTVLEGIKPCCYQKKIKIELKSQQPSWPCPVLNVLVWTINRHAH